jgi:putative nucleotidyltransferase with HDIG domain
MRNLNRAYRGVLAILSKFIQTVDADTEAHSTRVSMWSVRIARAMGMAGEVVEEIRVAGLLHDVGKVEVSVGLLRKAASLSKEEQTAVREHVSRGAAMVKPVGGMLTHIAEAIEAHHERYDGTGYRGLQGEEIPLVARIIAVADAFDALLSDRPYRKGVSMFEAVDAIVASSSGHFDPKIVTVLQEIVNRGGEQVLAEIHQSVGASI